MVGQTGNVTGVHLHFEVRDGVTNRNPYTGNSVNHSARRLRGIGWYPWYPDPSSHSGFTIAAGDPHKVGQCRSVSDILILWPAHSQFTHPNHQEQYRYDGTLGQKTYAPPMIVNASHGVAGGNVSFDIDVVPQNYFIHLRSYDATLAGWAANYEVAHQGPYPLGINCPSSTPPGYKDNIPEDDP